MSDHPTPRPPRRSQARSLDVPVPGSQILRETLEAVRDHLTTQARHTVEHFFDKELLESSPLLLKMGLGFYHEGIQYAREIDRLVIGAYLGVLIGKICTPIDVSGLPPVTSEEVSQTLRVSGCEVASHEVSNLCKALGLPLASQNG